MKNLLTLLAKKFLVPIGLTASESAVQKEIIYIYVYIYIYIYIYIYVIILLPKTKLNGVEVLFFYLLIISNISTDEFVAINNVLK